MERALLGVPQFLDTKMRRFLIIMLVLSCFKGLNKIENYGIPNYEQKIDNGKIAEYEKDKKSWEIEAGEIVDVNGFYRVYDFNLIFYDENGISGTLRGDSGIMDKVSKDMKAFGNVVFTSKDSSFLKTNKLYWHNFSRRIYTDDSVYIYDAKNKRELWGIGFKSDDQFKHIRIMKNVRGKGEGRLTK